MDFLKTGFDIQRMDSFNYLKNNLVLWILPGFACSNIRPIFLVQQICTNINQTECVY